MNISDLQAAPDRSGKDVERPNGDFSFTFTGAQSPVSPEPAAQEVSTRAPGEAFAPITFDELLSDPHIWSLYRDEGYFLAYTSQSPLAELAEDFPEIEEIAKGAFNRLAQSYLWGASVEEIDDTYEQAIEGFGLSEFGVLPKNDLELYDLIHHEAVKRDAVMLPQLLDPDAEPDPFDEAEYDRASAERFQNNHPVLHALREIMRGARDSVRETVQPEMPKVGGTLREQQEQFRETFRNLNSLASSSFNPAQAIVSDDGQGNLTPNWRGIGAIGVNTAMGLGIARLSGGLPRPWRRKTTKPSVAEKPNAMEPIHLGPKKTRPGPTASGKSYPIDKAPAPEGLVYDGETKQVRQGDKIIPHDQVAEASQRLGENDARAHQPAIEHTEATSSIINETTSKGLFNIHDWSAYPSSLPRPSGPFRILKGIEYIDARVEANRANRAIRAKSKSLEGQQIHEIQPIKFGGNPVDLRNKIPLSIKSHKEVTNWWRSLQRDIEKGSSK